MSAEATPEQENSLRLFIAISVPEAVKREIARTQDELRAALSRSRVSWSNPDQIHLTLRFLGKMAKEQVEPMTGAVRRVCENFGELNLRACGIGAFPNLRRPRVIWVGVEEEPKQLLQLQKGIQAATQPFTLEPAEDRFHAHLTLGRVKEIRRDEVRALEKQTAILQKKAFGAWEASQIEIMRSELSPKGARHTCLETISLSA